MTNTKPRIWPYVLACLLGAVLITFAVGMLTGWGPRNASGWPIP